MNKLIISNKEYEKKIEHDKIVNEILKTITFFDQETINDILSILSNKQFGITPKHHEWLYPEQILFSYKTIESFCKDYMRRLINEGHTFNITSLNPIMATLINFDEVIFVKKDGQELELDDLYGKNITNAYLWQWSY